MAAQGNAIGVGAHHHAHDPGVEGEQQDDATNAAHTHVYRAHVALRGSVQQQAAEQEDRNHHVQAEHEALAAEMVEQVDGSHGHQRQAEDAAVVDALGRGFAQRLFSGGFHQLGRVGDLGVLARMHGAVEQRQADEQQRDDGQVQRREQGFGDRYRFGQHARGHPRQVGSAAGQRQRHGAGKAAVPDQETRIGRRHQQRVVDALDLTGQRAGEDGADHQAEAPVHPAADQRHQGDHDDRLTRRAGHAGQAVELAVDQGGTGQRVTGDEDQRHLHGEAEQGPEAAAPVLHHGR